LLKRPKTGRRRITKTRTPAPPEPTRGRSGLRPVIPPGQSGSHNDWSQRAGTGSHSTADSVTHLGEHIARPTTFNAERYDLWDIVGQGGMGVVYKAHDRVLDRIIAFKVLNQQFSDNPQAKTFFTNEAKALARLRHEGIVTVFDVGVQSGLHYIAQEWVDGATLSQMLAQRGPLPEVIVRAILVQACRALIHAHRQGLIHCDVKPSNLMLTKDGGSLKLLDFGLARFYNAFTDDVLGYTPSYAAPEQLLGAQLGAWTDVFGLGAAAFKLLTGRAPFAGDVRSTDYPYMPAPSPQALRPDLSPDLEWLVVTALQPRPEQRFLNCEDMLRAILHRTQAR